MRGGRHHIYKDVYHGLWFFRGECSCGWRSRRRWKPVTAEADLFTHQRANRHK